MKRLIAVMLSCLSLTFCFCVPAEAAGGAGGCSTCACTGSTCKEEANRVQKGVENIVSHIFSVIWRGVLWGVGGQLISLFVPVSLSNIIVLLCFSFGCVKKAMQLYNDVSCNCCS